MPRVYRTPEGVVVVRAEKPESVTYHRRDGDHFSHTVMHHLRGAADRTLCGRTYGRTDGERFYGKSGWTVGEFSYFNGGDDNGCLRCYRKAVQVAGVV